MVTDDMIKNLQGLEAPLLAYPDTSIIARQGRGKIGGCRVIPLPAPPRASRGAPAACPAPDEIVRRFHERGGAPAISYGIVRDGELVHAAGFGRRTLDSTASGGDVPDERTVFRIASV